MSLIVDIWSPLQERKCASFAQASDTSARVDYFVLEALRAGQIYTLTTRGIEPCPADGFVLTSEVLASGPEAAPPLLPPEEQTRAMQHGGDARRAVSPGSAGSPQRRGAELESRLHAPRASRAEHEARGS